MSFWAGSTGPATVDPAQNEVVRQIRRGCSGLDHRAVLPTALTADELAALVGAPARKLDGLPFNVVIARR